jgi:hypothetical protein
MATFLILFNTIILNFKGDEYKTVIRCVLYNGFEMLVFLLMSIYS